MRIQIVTIFITLFALPGANPLRSQQLPVNLRFNKFTTENGLSDNHVGMILKDKKGYLWMATQNGFDRFDGVEFKTFLHNPVDSNSVLSNQVYVVADDPLGRIWVATYDGLSVYNPVTGKFWNYRPPEAEFIKSRVFSVVRAHDGSMWFSTWNRLNEIDPKTFEITSYLIDSLPVNVREVSIDNFFEDHEGNFWFDSYHGVSFFNRKTHHVELLDKNFGLSFFYDDGKGHAWLGAWQNKLREYDFQSKKFTDYPFNNSGASTSSRRNAAHPAHANYAGMGSLLWIGTEYELAVFDTQTKRFIKYYTHDPFAPNSLPTGSINYGIFDDRNQLWLSTEAGLYTLNLDQLCINTLYFPAYPNRNVNGIIEDRRDNDLLWVAIDFGGMYAVNRNTGAINEHFLPGQKEPYDDLNSFGDLIQDANGIIWIAVNNGLIKFDPQTKRSKFVRAPIESLPKTENDFYKLILNDDGTIWFGCSVGIGKFFPATETFKYYYHYKADKNEHFEVHLVRTMMKDFEGRIWLFNRDDGWFIFDPFNERFTRVKIGGVDVQHFSREAIIETPDSTIWIATVDQLLFKKKNDSAFHSLHSPAMDGAIYRLVCDDSENLFIGMQTGLLKYEEKTGRFIKFSTTDGLTENQIYTGMSMGKNDILYIRGGHYLSAIDTKRLNKQYTNADLVFESLTINAKDTAVDFDLHKNKALELDYKQNQLAVRFRLLSLSDAQQVHYIYKLDGWDKEWVRSNTVNYAAYSNLPGGDYTLHVKAVYPDGTENLQQAMMMIYIRPPFWKTWWFYSLCALALIALLYFIYTLRLQRRLAVERIRSKISRDLHDDVGSTLTSINIWSDVAGRQLQTDATKSAEYIGRIRNSSQNMLDNMNDIIWAINPVNDTLEKVLIRMKLYASEMLEPKDISFLFAVDNEIKGTIIPMQYRREWYLIFKEAINNAAKYSEAKNVEVRIAMHQHNLNMHIKDDGKGFLLDENNQGNGLRNMKQRAQKMDGTLRINSSPGNGTEIILEQKFT